MDGEIRVRISGPAEYGFCRLSNPSVINGEELDECVIENGKRRESALSQPLEEQ